MNFFRVFRVTIFCVLAGAYSFVEAQAVSDFHGVPAMDFEPTPDLLVRGRPLDELLTDQSDVPFPGFEPLRPSWWGRGPVVIPRIEDIPGLLPGTSAVCCATCMCGGEPTVPIDKQLGPITESPVNTSPDISIINQIVPKAYLTTVGIQNPDGAIFCSGVLISPRSILTAAHCTCGDEIISTAFFGHSLFERNRSAFAISLPLRPDPRLKNKNFCQQRAAWKADTAQDKTYPKWDLAILRFAETLPGALAGLVLPAEPIANPDEGFSYLYGVGFGRADGVNAPGTKHRSRLVFETRRCTQTESKEYGCNVDTENVTGGFEAGAGADSCFADSGGPIFARYSDDNMLNESLDVPHLIAITSRGLGENSLGFCGKGAINTNIEHEAVRSWIEQNL